MIGIGFIDDLISEVGMPLVKKGVKALTGIDLSKEELTNEDKQKIMDSQIEIMKIDFDDIPYKILDLLFSDHLYIHYSRIISEPQNFCQKVMLLEYILSIHIKCNYPCLFFLY